MDVDQGWQTGRLDLEPLLATHAAELAPVLNDPALHEFTGGTPLDATALIALHPPGGAPVSGRQPGGPAGRGRVDRAGSYPPRPAGLETGRGSRRAVADQRD
jgi:hypothetical protein